MASTAAPRRQPEDVAALVNGLLVLLVPVGIIIASWIGFNASGAVRARVSSPIVYVAPNLFQVGAAMTRFVPLAMLAGWRTWVHAKRVREHQGSGWQGVAEAGALGFLLAIVVLAHGILTRPADALPYVVFYGGAALLIGVALGCVLRATGLLVLKYCGQR
jgi:hypothetical protein